MAFATVSQWKRPSSAQQMVVTAIDPGVSNLALVVGVVDTGTFELVRVIECQKVNMKNSNQPDEHWHTPFDLCTIPHTNEMVDCVAHLVQKFRPLLELSELILMEQQPITGSAYSTQQLIMQQYRTKVVIMYTIATQALLDLPRAKNKSTDEEQTWAAQQRKSRTIGLARPFLQDFPLWKKNQLTPQEEAEREEQQKVPYAERKQSRRGSAEEKRQHDMADALCNILAWCKTMQNKYGVVPARSSADPSCPPFARAAAADAAAVVGPPPGPLLPLDNDAAVVVLPPIASVVVVAPRGAADSRMVVDVPGEEDSDASDGGDRLLSRGLREVFLAAPPADQAAIYTSLSSLSSLLGLTAHCTIDFMTEFSLFDHIEKHKQEILDLYREATKTLGLPSRCKRARYALAAVLKMVGVQLVSTRRSRVRRTRTDDPDFLARSDVPLHLDRYNRYYRIAPLGAAAADTSGDENAPVAAGDNMAGVNKRRKIDDALTDPAPTKTAEITG